MALIKLDPIVDKISGKVGGQSFVAGTNGNYIRNNAQTRKGTLNQGYQSKTKTPGVNATWIKLSPAEKQTFIDLVGTYPYTNRINEIQQYSAYQIFILCAQGTQLIDESIKFSGSAFVVIDKPTIEVFVNNSASMTIEILNPQIGIFYAIYATSPQGVGVYSVRRQLRYLGFVTESIAANKFDISAIYDNRFNTILENRNYGIMVKPVVLNSGQIGPSSDIAVQPFVFVPTPPPGTNIYIYGVSSVITNATQLSTVLSIPLITIIDFTIIDDDVFAEIDTPFDIPVSAFDGSTLLTGFEDPTGLINIINNFAFRSTSALQSALFNGLTTIQGNVFQNSALTAFIAPQVISIGGRAFENSNIIELNFPNFNGAVQASCFRSMSNLTTLNIPALTQVQDNAFQDTNLLNTALDVNGIVNFKFRCFLNATNLPLVVNSTTCLRVFIFAFSESGIVSFNGPNVTQIDQAGFSFTSITSFDLPSATIIATQAFRNNSALTTVLMPAVTSLGSSPTDANVFLACPNVANVTCPIALQTINAGNPHASIQYLVTNFGTTITYV